MPRRLIVVTALAAGMSIAAVITLATPALAKGPSQARITGPGLTRAIVVSGAGEGTPPAGNPRPRVTRANGGLGAGGAPRPAPAAVARGQTGLFTVLFGA